MSWVAIGYLLFGIALYTSSNRLPSAIGNIYWVSIPFIGTSLAILFPFIATWKPQFRLFYLPLYDSLRDLQLNIGETIHPNILAGALVLTLPIMVVLAFGLKRSDQWYWLRHLFSFFAILQLGALLLSQSRGGYLAFAAALATILLLRWPRLCYLLPLVIIGLFLMIRGVGLSTILEQFSSDSALGGWSGRLEIWQTSLTAITDFPFTGIGIGTFTTVIPLLYPLTFPIESYPHAHNLFLQIALDLGLPGLIAYLALLMNLGAMLIVTLRKAPRHTMIHTLAIGATGSLVGMLTHGLLDAVTWGTKLSFLPWILFALITQLFLHVQRNEQRTLEERYSNSA